MLVRGVQRIEGSGITESGETRAYVEDEARYLKEVWDEVESILKENARFEAMIIFEWLQREYPV